MGRNTHSTKCMYYITVTVLTARVGECPILCISVVATLEWMPPSPPPPPHTHTETLLMSPLLATYTRLSSYLWAVLYICLKSTDSTCALLYMYWMQFIDQQIIPGLMTTTTAMHLTFSVVMWPNTSMRLYYNCWASGSCCFVCVCVGPVDINFVLFQGTYPRPIGNRILLSFPILFHYSNEKW